MRGPEPENQKQVKALTLPGLSEKRVNPPIGMGSVARKTWKHIVGSLPPSHFRPGDVPLLVAYCEAFEKACRMQETLRAEGDFQTSKIGTTVAHPAHAIKLAQENLMAQLATKLRLCANSRLSKAKAAFEKVEEPTANPRRGLMFGGR